MSTEEERKALGEKMEKVRILIENCLVRHMNREQVVNFLAREEKIDPTFTELVWQRLENDNEEFFKLYRLRLVVKKQIEKFNELLETQAEMMCRLRSTGAASISISNGCHVAPVHQNGASYVTEHIRPTSVPVNMQQPQYSCLPNSFTNGGAFHYPVMPTAIDMPCQGTGNNFLSDTMLAHSSNIGLAPGMNGEMNKAGIVFPGGHPYLHDFEGNDLYGRAGNAEASLSSSTHVESSPMMYDVYNFDELHSEEDFNIGTDLTDCYIPTLPHEFLNPDGKQNNEDGDGTK